MERYDVVVVGGGIAGSALGAVLAPAGLSVLVLEREVEFRDRVRGEFMQPWGVAEMLRLGLDETLIGGGGGYCRRLIGYDEDSDPTDAAARAVPLDALLTGVPGAFCVGHPQACTVLRALAEQRGATVRSGVGDVMVAAGSNPTVRYEHDGTEHDVATRLVVGADGRQSKVRRDLGIGIEQVTSTAMLGGMLVKADGWPADESFTGTEGDVHYLVFPRPNGYVRLYLCCEQGERTTGAHRAEKMLAAFHLASVPGSERLAGAEPAGPCAYYPGSDAWTDGPVVEGAVLIGDAAGWSDPIIGEGLSVAMRDVRSVSDVLLASDDWSPPRFDDYVAERAERMRRLRIGGHLQTEIRCTFTPDGRRRRGAFRAETATNPMTLAPLLSLLMGPEAAPAEAFEPANVDRILSLS